MLKKLFLVVLLLSIASICFAQGSDQSEQLTITTYYPSPYGVYKTLRIFPYDAEPPTCNPSSSGTQYFSGSWSGTSGTSIIVANSMYYCDGTNWITHREAKGEGSKAVSVVPAALQSYHSGCNLLDGIGSFSEITACNAACSRYCSGGCDAAESNCAGNLPGLGYKSGVLVEYNVSAGVCGCF